MVLSDYLQIALICSALISRIHHGVSSRGGVEVGERGFLERGGAQESIVSKYAGAGQFGSGWCWLVADKDGSLKVTKTENGVNPLCFGQTALLGCDVWEHSYYIDFRNKRPAYLANFLDKLVNWENVAERLANA